MAGVQPSLNPHRFVPPSDSHCWRWALGRATVWLSLQSAQWAGPGDANVALSECLQLLPSLRPLPGTRADPGPPRMPQASSGPAESIISATIIISSNISGFSICKMLWFLSFHCILTMTMGYYYSPCCTEEENQGSEGSRDLPKVTWLIGGGVGFRTLAFDTGI